jgi:hypothetical protein
MSTSPRGVDAVLPGQADDVGSNDPASTSPAGAYTNAHAQNAELNSDIVGQGNSVGDQIPLPGQYPIPGI